MKTMNFIDIISKYKAKLFYCDLYGVNYYLIEAKGKKYLKIQQEINDNLGEIKVSDSNGKCIMYEGDFLIIMQNFKDDRIFTHELIHIVFDLFDERGIPINNDNQETFAYYYAYLFKNFKKLTK